MSTLLTTAEAAARLRITAQSVRCYIKSGKLKAEKLNRLHRITPEAIDDFLRSQQGK